jgi:ubiquinone/menaquinone biosynthesis C-methylase UbiE
MQEVIYPGKELELFQHASVWKKYFAGFIKPYLDGNVLEVGAGIGGTTEFLCDSRQESWICLEPDQQLFEKLKSRINSDQLPSSCIAMKGTIHDLDPNQKFNAILYIDVLEHIADDATELAKAGALLSDEGYMIVLCPAHQSIYSAFDKSIGHHRRYNKASLKRVVPRYLHQTKLRYLDSIGFLASLMNKYMLHQPLPTLRQIKIWDNWMIPISRIADLLSFYSTGRSVLGVWQKRISEEF